ncbi:zeta toxin domain-containing protein, partial [Parachaetomium inaequale]
MTTDILHTQILPTELHPFLPSPTSSPPNVTPRRRQKKPLAVLLLGQTGAGKTRLAPLLLSAFPPSQESPPPLHLIADTYKTYHPSYSACLASHRPELASRLTSAAAAAWLHSVCVHAAQSHIPNILIETACRREGDFERLAETFLGQGYVVRVVVLGVPAALSRLGVMVRYWMRLPEAGPARGLPVRLTPRGVHDGSFGGVGGAVGWVD